MLKVQLGTCEWFYQLHTFLECRWSVSKRVVRVLLSAWILESWSHQVWVGFTWNQPTRQRDDITGAMDDGFERERQTGRNMESGGFHPRSHTDTNCVKGEYLWEHRRWGQFTCWFVCWTSLTVIMHGMNVSMCVRYMNGFGGKLRNWIDMCCLVILLRCNSLEISSDTIL